MLGEEPKRDPRPWARGGEAELLVLDQAVSRAHGRKRSAETAEQWHEANVDVRQAKRSRLTKKHKMHRTELIKEMLLGFSLPFGNFDLGDPTSLLAT